MASVQARSNQHNADNQNGSDAEETDTKAAGEGLTEKLRQTSGGRSEGTVCEAAPPAAEMAPAR